MVGANAHRAASVNDRAGRFSQLCFGDSDVAPGPVTGNCDENDEMFEDVASLRLTTWRICD